MKSGRYVSIKQEQKAEEGEVVLRHEFVSNIFP